jgi:hypothetical protein
MEDRRHNKRAKKPLRCSNRGALKSDDVDAFAHQGRSMAASDKWQFCDFNDVVDQDVQPPPHAIAVILLVCSMLRPNSNLVQ